MKNNNNETNALSLFDGMSCFQIALKELNIKIDNYYASEVDKHAIAQTKHAFPNTIHLGDVRDIDVNKLPYISILGGGSPCQSFSFAGKMKGMSTKESIKILELDHYLELKSKNFEFEGQSYLFWEYMRILRDIQKYNPDVEFLLENVVMTKEWELVLSRAIGIAPIMINAALVSAQNRKRLYWTNIHNFPQGFLGDPVCEIPQPKDRGILLKDILEPVVDEKYFLSDKMVKSLSTDKNLGNGVWKGITPKTFDSKAFTVTARVAKMGKADNYIKVDKQGNVKQNQDKASCFTAGGNSGGNHSDMDLFIVAQRGRNPDNPKDRTVGSPTEQMLEPRNDGKTNCLTTVQKDNLVMQINPSKESNGKQPFQQNRIYDSEGISPALCAHKSDLIIQIPEATKKGYVEIQPGECFDFEHPDSSTSRGRKMTDKSNTLMASETKFMQLTKDFRIRRLTPLECSRLQTVPAWYTWGNTSDTQIYRQLGNGWCIEVIKHILSYSNLNKK
jgi:DNA (cytosine-5)-methyltransferase 3A